MREGDVGCEGGGEHGGWGLEVRGQRRGGGFERGRGWWEVGFDGRERAKGQRGKWANWNCGSQRKLNRCSAAYI